MEALQENQLSLFPEEIEKKEIKLPSSSSLSSKVANEAFLAGRSFAIAAEKEKSKLKRIKAKAIVPEGLEKWMMYLFEVVLIKKTEIPGYKGCFRENEVILEFQHKYEGHDILKEIAHKTKIGRVKELKILKTLGYGAAEF